MGMVKLTQYMRPNGRKEEVKARISDEATKKAEGMILSCEVLGTGMVALYAKYPEEEDGEELIRLLPNGPGVREELEKLILEKWEAKNVNLSNMQDKNNKRG